MDTRSRASAWERAVPLLLVSSSACLGQFVVPDGGLPEVRVGEARITFMPNGAFVVSRDGVQFMDGGLGFATKGHERWGEQIRGFRPPDAFSMSKLEGSDSVLAFSGVLRDANAKDAMGFRQQVTLGRNGLRLDYRIMPIEPVALDRTGITFHFPVRRLVGQKLHFLPGFLDLLFPTDFPRADGGGYVGKAAGRRVLVARETPYEVALSVRETVEWMVFDDRAWHLSTYRVWLNFPVPKGGVPDEGLELAFEIAFDAEAPLSLGGRADEGRATLPIAVPPDVVPEGGHRPATPETAREKGVTFNPDGSLTIWDGGARVAEAGLVVDTGVEAGKALTFQSHFAGPEAHPRAEGGDADQAKVVSFRGQMGRYAPEGLVQYREHVCQAGPGLKIQYHLDATDALIDQLKKTPHSFRAGVALFLRSDAFDDQSASTLTTSALAAVSDRGLRIEAGVPRAATWTASADYRWDSDGSLLGADDIWVWPRFCSLLTADRLRDREPALRIWQRLPHSARRTIQAVAKERVEQKESPPDVLAHLNSLLTARDLYREGCFPNVQVLLRAEGLLRNGRVRTDLSPSQVQRLNRLLLEAAYPSEIAISTNARLYYALLPWPIAEPTHAPEPAAEPPPDEAPKAEPDAQPASDPLKTLTFELALRFASRPQADEVPAKPSSAAAQVSRVKSGHAPRGAQTGAVTALPDDTSTRGDWQGQYGAHAYILCGRYSPQSLEGGRGWPVKYRIYTGRPDDSARLWVSSLDATRLQSALWNPIEQNRQYSVWDDHGEVYPRGTGPDLYIDLEIPKGSFCLSLYFMESDWIQYRAYTISIFDTPPSDRHGVLTMRSRSSAPDRHGLLTTPSRSSAPDRRGLLTTPTPSPRRLLAQTTVHDFFDGVYKRFLVLGPQKLTIKIARDDSTNATLAGLFLDRAPTLLPVPEPLGDMMRKQAANQVRGPHAQAAQAKRAAKANKDDRIVSPDGGRQRPQRVASRTPATPVSSSSQTRAVRDLLKSYESLRRLQTQAQADSHELGLRSGALAELRDSIQSSLQQALPPSDRAVALWMLWQCQEQLFTPKHTTSGLLKEWTQAVREASRREHGCAVLRATADELFALGGLDASELVHDSYLEALAHVGRKPGKGADRTVEDAIEKIALQYYSLERDTRYGLRKWQDLLDHITSHRDKAQAVARLRRAAKETYRLAQKRYAQSRGEDPTGYLLPIAALRHVRERYGQKALTTTDQALLARACKNRLFFLWGTEDYVQEYETLLHHYPDAPGRPGICLEAMGAHLLLAQQTNDYSRAQELASTLSTKYPSSPEAADAQLQIVSDYYLYRHKYAEAGAALNAFEKRYGKTQANASVAHLRKQVLAVTHRTLLPIPGTRTSKGDMMRKRPLPADDRIVSPDGTSRRKPLQKVTRAGSEAHGPHAQAAQATRAAKATKHDRIVSPASTSQPSRGEPLQKATIPALSPSPREPTIQDLRQTYQSLRQRQASARGHFYEWSQKTGALRDLAAQAQSLIQSLPPDDGRADARWVLWQCRAQAGLSPRESETLLRQYLDDIKATCTRMRRLRLLRDVDRHLFESHNFAALDVATDHYLEAMGGTRRGPMALASLKRLALRYYAAGAWRPYGRRRWQQYLDRVLAEQPKDRAVQILRRAAQEAASPTPRRPRARRHSLLDPYDPHAMALEAIRAKYGKSSLTNTERKLLSSIHRPTHKHGTLSTEHRTPSTDSSL